MDRIVYALSGVFVFGVIPSISVLVCWSHGGPLLSLAWAVLMCPAWTAVGVCIWTSWAGQPDASGWSELPRRPRNNAAPAALAVHFTEAMRRTTPSSPSATA